MGAYFLYLYIYVRHNSRAGNKAVDKIFQVLVLMELTFWKG